MHFPSIKVISFLIGCSHLGLTSLKMSTSALVDSESNVRKLPPEDYLERQPSFENLAGMCIMALSVHRSSSVIFVMRELSRYLETDSTALVAY